MKRGFTLIEMLVALAIMILLSIVALLNLAGRRDITNLNDATVQAASILRTAQSHAMSQYKGSAWGVHFMNATNTAPFYALFQNSYSTTTTAGYYRLPAGVGYVTSTLNIGSSTDIIFSQISGTASVSTTIGFYLLNQVSQSSTVSVASSGSIVY